MVSGYWVLGRFGYLIGNVNLPTSNAGGAGRAEDSPYLALPLCNKEDVCEQEQGQLVTLTTQHILSGHLDTLKPANKAEK